jgi:hypothetical protein
MAEIDMMGIDYDNSNQILPDVRAKSLPYPRIPQPSPTSGQEERLSSQSSKYVRCGIFLVVGIIVACIVSVAALVIGVFLMVNSSGAYQLAMETAQENETVNEVLGSPITSGLFTTGSVSDNGSDGSADLSIPVSGSKQSGTLIVTAIKEAGAWRITTMTLDADGKQYPIIP